MSASVEADRADVSRAALYKGIEERQLSEYDRLRLQHRLHLDAMGGRLVCVPLSTTEPIRILDSATGDGTWMRDVALQYPNASLMGTDVVEKHFQQIKQLPPQVSFKIQSVLEDWPTSDQSVYDLVHQRYCLSMFNPARDEAIVSRLFGLVKPGGYIQLVDIDFMAYEGGDEHPGMAKLMSFVHRAFTDAGMNPSPGPLIKGWLEKAGAVDVKEQVLSFPVGCKAATLDDQVNTSSNFASIIDNFTAIGAKTPDYWYKPEEFKALRVAVLEDLATHGNRWPFYVVTAKRAAIDA